MRNLAQIDRWACYYGSGALDTLAQLPMAILQPDAYCAGDLTALRNNGCYTLAYLSIGEEEPGAPNAPWQKRDAEGKRIRNARWQTFLVDIGHPDWRSHVLQSAQTCIKQGFGGLFLDTLDTVAVPAMSKSATLDLIGTIKNVLPDAALVANRGFALLPEVASMLDGVVFEAFSTYADSGRYHRWRSPALEQNAAIAQVLLQTCQQHDILGMALDYASDSDSTLETYAARRALAHGLLPFVTNAEVRSLGFLSNRYSRRLPTGS
jgi:polysaccharide biosynthesis protein PelA